MTTAPPVAKPTRLHVPGRRQQVAALSRERLMLVMLLFLAAILGIILKIMYLTFTGQSADDRAGAMSSMPLRPDIVDRNGETLARTIDAWSIGVHADRLLTRPEDLAPQLAVLMPEKTAEQYLALLKSRKHFIYLRRRAMPELVEAVNALGEPGMAFAREPERLYPQAELAAHVLGWTNLDGTGVTGMEKLLDKRMSDPKYAGKPVVLSIDSRVQAAVEKELAQAMLNFQARGATGIVLDVHSGEVIALTSLPSFNPNDPGRSPPETRFNQAITGVYELGSTFKPITIAAAMDAGVVTSLSKRYDATAPLKVGKFSIRDDHPTKRWLNVPEMLVHSSNIVTARIADELGKDRLNGMFMRLGFGEPVAIEMAGRGRPIQPVFWARTTTMTAGYGHGIAVTPMHLAKAYAALANGGIMHPVTLLKREPGAIVPGTRVISPQVSYRIRQFIRMVVLEGTGKQANAPGLRVGGKTGTAEKASQGGYARRSLVSTFAGVFPVDDPKYAIVMMLDEPKGTAETYGYATAGWTAAPVVRKVVARIGPLLGIIPDGRKDIPLEDIKPLIWHPKEGEE